MRSSYFNFSQLYIEGSPKPTARCQLLSRLQQVRAWLPFQSWSLIQQNFQVFLKIKKKSCFESPKHIRTRRDDWVLDFYKSGLGPSTSSYIFTEGSQLSAGTRWGPCCFVWTHTFSCKTVLIYKALQFINSADENTVEVQRKGLNIQLFELCAFLTTRILMLQAMLQFWGFTSNPFSWAGFFNFFFLI